MTVHISVPYKGVNWTRNFPAPSKVRVKVPGLQYIVKEMRFSVFIQLNLTKVSVDYRAENWPESLNLLALFCKSISFPVVYLLL